MVHGEGLEGVAPPNHPKPQGPGGAGLEGVAPLQTTAQPLWWITTLG